MMLKDTKQCIRRVSNKRPFDLKSTTLTNTELLFINMFFLLFQLLNAPGDL